MWASRAKAAQAQFGLGVFTKVNRLRRRRHATEYPAENSPGVTTEDALQAIAVADEAIAAVMQLLASDKLVPFD